MRSRLLLLAAAFLWSTAGAAMKLRQLSGWQIAGGRSLVAGVFLFLAVRGARRMPSVAVLATAVGYAATVILFAVSNKLTTAANAIFIQSTAPLWVVLLAPRLLGERPSRVELLTIPIYAVGLDHAGLAVGVFEGCSDDASVRAAHGQALGGAGFGEERAPQLALGTMDQRVRGQHSLEVGQRALLADHDHDGHPLEPRHEGGSGLGEGARAAPFEEGFPIMLPFGGEVVEFAVARDDAKAGRGASLASRALDPDEPGPAGVRHEAEGDLRRHAGSLSAARPGHTKT